MGFLKSLGRGYLSEQSHQKKKGEKVSILEKFRDYLSGQSHKKKEKKCQFWKSLEIICLNSPTKKGEKVSILEKFRDYLSGQSHKKKGEKVSILEKFRKRLFVGTVPPKKKREKKCKFLISLRRGYLSEQSRQKKVKKCQFF